MLDLNHHDKFFIYIIFFFFSQITFYLFIIEDFFHALNVLTIKHWIFNFVGINVFIVLRKILFFTFMSLMMCI